MRGLLASPVANATGIHMHEIGFAVQPHPTGSEIDGSFLQLMDRHAGYVEIGCSTFNMQTVLGYPGRSLP